MILLEKNNLFNGYSDLLLLGVYSDRIIAEIVRKDENGVKVIAGAIEPIEGGVRDGGGVSAEKIRLNCEKAIQGLPPDLISNVKDVACFLGAGASRLSFSIESKIREDRDRNISDEEVVKLISKDEVASVTVEESFLVDGFSIGNPVGMNGKEITALVSRVGWSEDLEKELIAIAAARGMRYGGAMDARVVFLRFNRKNAKDYCAIFIFDEETDICVVRGELIAAVAEVGAGYGIMAEKMAQALAIGLEEAKSVIGRFKNNQADRSAVDVIKMAVKGGELEIVDKIRAALLSADKKNLLPGNVFVVIAGDYPRLGESLMDRRWLDGLPIDRNASIHFDNDALGQAILRYIE